MDKKFLQILSFTILTTTFSSESVNATNLDICLQGCREKHTKMYDWEYEVSADKTDFEICEDHCYELYESQLR